jgi:probable HAF family extracellular repeat protein
VLASCAAVGIYAVNDIIANSSTIFCASMIRFQRTLRLSGQRSTMKLILISIAAGSLLAQTAPTYTVTDLGVLGTGTNSSGFDINNSGWVAGSSNQTPTGPQIAFLWYGGNTLVNLGTLGGAACTGCNSGAGGPNASGEAVIGSETATMDPLNQDFCGFGTHRQCLGAVWSNGKLTALSTLPGGRNANAFGINNKGQTVGFSEIGIRDGSCATATAFQVTRFEAVLWGPKGQIRELPPLVDMGDTASYAMGLNDHGQAVGSSGNCATQGLPPANVTGLHAVLWEKDGSPTYLGTLGDAANTMFNNASSVNNLGEVVGTSQFKDGTVHSFLWTKNTGMQDLGTFPGAGATIAGCCNTINNRGEVVGFSIDGKTGNSRAFYWRNTVLSDLNALVAGHSPLYLLAAYGINDSGDIVGQGCVMPACTELHAFIAQAR